MFTVLILYCDFTVKFVILHEQIYCEYLKGRSMVYNCFTVKPVFIPKQLLLTYKIRHYSFQVFTDKLVPISKNTVSLPFNS